MEEPSDDENDMLDLAFGLTETSRLGCQVTMSKALDGLVVKLPTMTRNMQANQQVMLQRMGHRSVSEADLRLQNGLWAAELRVARSGSCLKASDVFSALLQPTGGVHCRKQRLDVHIEDVQEVLPRILLSFINELVMTTSDPASHDDGRRYATFFDIPLECRDLCYIEFLQTFCGDGICRPDKSRPAVDGAASIRVLNKRVCEEFDALVCTWVRGIRCTVRNTNFGSLITCMNKLDEDLLIALDRSTTPRETSTSAARTPAAMHLRIDFDVSGALGNLQTLRQNISRWLNCFAIQPKRGSTWRISYELPTFAAGDATKLIGFLNEISFAARRYGLPVPLMTWSHARQARALPSDAYTVPPSASARELSNIINAISDYNLRVHEAEVRGGFGPRGQSRWSTREEFNAGMEALRRSRISGASWDQEYARIRTPAR
nr:hypothetical protein B0A51_17468 [Rachicladosporium sp. CCFEE 5018]